MKGRWFIDNIDIANKFGIGIVKNGYYDLLSYPSLKEPDYNDWAEHDGIEVDLFNPKLNTKDINIEFVSLGGDNVNTERFLAFLSDVGYRTLRINSLGKEWRLRVSKETSRSVFRNGQKFTIQFIEDLPTRNTGVKSGLPISYKTPYSVDGVRFDEYGIIITAGKESVFAMPDLKTNLTINSKYSDGAFYDTGISKFKERDVTLKCCLLSSSILNFWNNYNAFFSDLVKPNERIFETSFVERERFRCFYRSMNITNFIKNSRYVACWFDLKLCFTDSRPKDELQRVFNIKREQIDKKYEQDHPTED